jgi:ankyrin repeat protein
MADLFDLVSSGELAALREALHLDPKLAGGRNAAGSSLLAWAAYHRNSEAIAVVRLAVLEIDPYEACILGDAERVAAALADGWDANAPAPDGFSALGLAAFFGREAIADLLLPVTRDVNQQAENAQRVAALHAATAARQRAVATKLLRAGANPNLAQAGGIVPLHVAAQHGDAAFCGLLTLFGADPHLPDEQGRNAAAYARAGGHDWLAERLQRL